MSAKRFRDIHVGGTVVVALCLLGMSRSALAEQTATVRLLSGRSFSGELLPGPSRDYFSLRSSIAGLDMIRRIAWSSVVSVELDGQELSEVDFKSRAADAVDPGPGGQPSLSELGAPLSASQAAKRLPLVGEVTMNPAADDRVHYAVMENRSSPRVRISSIYLDAYVANWDRDVESDGLIVHLYALAEDGSLATARGSLELQLTAEQQGFNTIHQNFTDVGRWSRRARPNDFTGQGAVYRLEFQALHPDFDLELRAQGLLHARLTVPGHGVFEASCAAVRIRPYSPVRDRLEQQKGVRFFSHEGLSRTQ